MRSDLLFMNIIRCCVWRVKSNDPSWMHYIRSHVYTIHIVIHMYIHYTPRGIVKCMSAHMELYKEGSLFIAIGGKVYFFRLVILYF